MDNVINIYSDGIVTVDGVPVKAFDISIGEKLYSPGYYSYTTTSKNPHSKCSVITEVVLTLRTSDVTNIGGPYTFKMLEKARSVMDFMKINHFDDDQLKLLEAMCRLKRNGG